MLTEKPWKADAVLRLLVGVLVCVLLMALANTAFRYFEASARPHPAIFVAATAGASALMVGAILLLSGPWRLERFLLRSIALLGCMYGGFFLGWVALRLSGSGTESPAPDWKILALVPAGQILVLVLLLRFVREHGIGCKEGFGFGVARGRTLLLGGLTGCFLFVGARGLQAASALVMEQLRMKPREQSVVELLRTSESHAAQIVLGVAAILLAPVVEEMLFRGILYPAIKRSGHPHVALWCTSIAFAAIHCNLATFVPLTFLALLLVWLYERAGNLLAPITAHSLFNALNFAALYWMSGS